MHTARVCVVKAVLLTLAAGTAVAGCATTDPGTGSVAAPCRQFESFSGQLVVGQPPPAPTVTAPILVEPGEQPPPAPALPTVHSIETGGNVVVFDLRGNGTVGWTARFVQLPLLRGTDEPVPVAGRCVLQIDLTGVDSEATGPPVRLAPGGAAVVEVRGYPSVNGVIQAFVGIGVDRPTVTVEADRRGAVLSVAVAP